ncbi:hypothetical protein [Roseimaritima sediminicola]|uniref:hypothetical protein n=1 Tax=Roseimaritima sediminicola TaxID=2662066 RepID=UPI0012983AB4|nr:hypothetical protein [Roseimaritima sediminicola]
MANHRATLRPLNANYWLRVDEQRPEATAWPAHTAASLAAFCMPVGFERSEQLSTEQVLYSSIGATLYHNSQPELGLVNFKKAEGFASGDDVMWLRIAQSECLAALGQDEAAATLLAGPASSKNPSVASAAAASLGIAKLKSGAYEQGAAMLHKALHQPGSADWPTRDEAEADLALTQLIIGDTDLRLKALHAAQEKFRLRGDKASLLQSLENELQILRHEGRTEKATGIEQRIREIERLP